MKKNNGSLQRFAGSLKRTAVSVAKVLRAIPHFVEVYLDYRRRFPWDKLSDRTKAIVLGRRVTLLTIAGLVAFVWWRFGPFFGALAIIPAAPLFAIVLLATLLIDPWP